MSQVLIAGVGNELKQDDAFGVEFVKEWNRSISISAEVKTLEVGIGGIHLVQELHEGYATLVLVDAVDRENLSPGDLIFEEVTEISDITSMPLAEKRAFLADMHYTNPVRALMLAQALEVLPPKVFILGCQAGQHDDFAIGMSAAVQDAMGSAINKLQNWLQEHFKISCHERCKA